MTLDQLRTTRRQQAIPSTSTTSKPDPSQTVLNQILGDRTLLEFDQLPVSERNITLRSYLSQKTGPIVIDAIAAWNELNRDVKAANNPQNPPSSPAEDDSDLYFARNRLQLAAYEVCFSENTFLVSIRRLPGFVQRFGPQGSKSVTQLVKHITIAIPNSYGLSPSEVRIMAKDLRLLLDFTSAEQVGVRIIGPGPPDGTDWYTQEMIRIISPTVRDLINQFGSRFSIVRSVSGDNSQDILGYWTAPCSFVDEPIDDSDLSFRTVMQYQVEDWIQRHDASDSNNQ